MSQPGCLCWQREFSHIYDIFLYSMFPKKIIYFYSQFQIHLSDNIMVLREHLRGFHGTDGGYY